MSLRIKILHCLLSVVALFLFSSCSETQKSYTIGVSQCSDDAWRRQMNGEILRETFMYGNVDVEFRSAGDDSNTQINDIKYFINKKVDLIVVSPNESEALVPIIERAYDSGIPIVVVDRKIKSEKYTAYISADNSEIGYAVGNYISSHGGGGSLKVVELTGLANSSPAQERHEGFMKAIRRHPEIELVAVSDAGWFRDEAFSKMDSILEAGTDVDIVFAQNDMMALGASEAAEKRGRSDIEFIGIDALAGRGLGLQSVADEVLAASFAYPTGGDKVLQVCMDILEGKQYKRINRLETAVVDSENVENMILQNAQIAELDQKIETLNGKISTYVSRYSSQKVVLFCILAMLVLIVVILIVAIKALMVRNRLNVRLREQKEQLESQYERMVELSDKLKDATHAKLVFFTNISHDFRTPLTLVADPVNQLLASPAIRGNDRRMVELIKKNTGILLRLVNQILDFRKYENGRMEYVPEPVDLKKNFAAWNEPFVPAAYKKHLHFRFNVADDGGNYVTMCDKAKLESIYFNLLSNAFKYTPENGDVTVALQHGEMAGKPCLRFSVSNTGSYISPEHAEKIFDRFYKTDLHHAGSGIGLALVKAFVDMHGGNITVESTEKGGTEFTVEIPLVECGADTSEPVPTIVDSGADLDLACPEELEEIEQSGKPLVLVIDDNVDICSYIASVLGDGYDVIDANAGLPGIRKAMKYVPDLVVCDVMMPGIDGIECCKRLKSEIQTCHIPVILLTACALDEQRMAGYSCGADSYISKPFNSELLISRIENLIAGRKMLKQYFGDNSSLVKENISDIDKDFVAKFKACVEENISDSGLGVEAIGKMMGMSRVQLYRKIKSLTNYTPVELIRITRLKKARSILSSKDITVSEAAYETGFSSPSYFAKCYKEYFGENPTALRSRAEEQ